MKLTACLTFLSLLFVTVRTQQNDDEDMCVCVEVYKCENGFITDPGEGSRPTRAVNRYARAVDPRLQTCEGIQICCPVRSGGPNPSRTTPPTVQPVDPAPTRSLGPPLPTIARLQGCGVRRFPGGQQGVDLGLRVSGAPGVSEDTFYGEAPWMARIHLNGQFVCGGTLVNEQVVLTGAHCVNGRRANEVSVEVGEWNAASNLEPQLPQKLAALNIVAHPEFNDKNLQNDVALIFLQSPFKITETVDTICTPDNVNQVDTNACVVVGWGKKETGSKFEYQPVLRKVPMPLVEHDLCVSKLRTTRLGQRFQLLPGFLCAGGVADADTCKGDGGGPLYCPMRSEPNRFGVIGITAWGIECGKGNPSVFASVPHYMPWISQQLNNDRLYQQQN